MISAMKEAKIAIILLLSFFCVAFSQRDYYFNPYGGRGGVPYSPQVADYSPSQFNSFNGLGGFQSFDAATDLIEADFHKFGGVNLGGGGGGGGQGIEGPGHGGRHGFGGPQLGVGNAYRDGPFGGGPGFGRGGFHGGFVRDHNYASSIRQPFFIQPSYGSQYTFLRR